MDRPRREIYDRENRVTHGWVVWICTVQKFRAFAPAPRFCAFGAKACDSVKSFAHLNSHLPLVFRELLLRFLLGPRRAAPTCVMDIDCHPSPRRLSLTGGSFSCIPFAPRTTVFIQSKRRTRSRSVGTHSAVRRSRPESGQKSSNSYRGYALFSQHIHPRSVESDAHQDIRDAGTPLQG